MDPRLSQRAIWAEGQPISDLMARALANPNLTSLAAGFVDYQTLPADAVRRALAALNADALNCRASLQYGTTLGLRSLRELIVDHFLAKDDALRGTSVSLDQVVLTAGSNQLLHLVADTLLDPGDIVLTAAPTYFVYLGTLNNVGARAVGVAADQDGMIPEALEETLHNLQSQGLLPRVKAIYVTPYFDNPTGATMPFARRAQIVATAKRWSARHKIHVISDEAYRALRYSGDDVPSMRVADEEGDTVIEAGTFSKSFSPGIRVGWGVLPENLIEPICNQKGNLDFGSPNFSQHVMAKVLEMHLFEQHVALLRETYRVKLRAMLNAAQRHFDPLPGLTWRRPNGGLYVWLELPPELDAGPDGPLLELALQEGVLYVPGQYCYPAEGEPSSRNTIRLSFGVQPNDRIEQGIAALARAIAEALQLARAI